MIRLAFRTKLLASYFALVAAVLVIFLFQLDRTLGADLRRQLDDRLERQAIGASQWVGEGGRRHPDKLAARLAGVVHADVTIVDRDGQVIGDSAKGTTRAETDAKDEEIVAARAGNTGHASRLDSASQEVHYVAIPAGDGLIVRLAAPVSDINNTLALTRRRLALAAAIAIAAALALGILASGFVARPLRAMTQSALRIAKGDYDIRVVSDSPDEFGILSRTLASLARELENRIGELTSERDRLSAILTGMVEGVLVIDEQDRIALANPAALSILRMASPNRQPVSDVVADKELQAAMQPISSESKPIEQEITTDGRTIAVYARSLPTQEEGAGRVVVLRDMTNIRQLMAMRRDFVANVSHELRTPVTSIQGYAETLLRGSLDKKNAEQFLEIIHRQSQRLARLVEDLLQLADVEARPLERISRERIAVSSFVTPAIDVLRDAAGARGQTLASSIPGDLYVLGDPEALEKVTMNLVDNAIKYGREKGQITVSGTQKNNRVVLRVTDDGPGIEPQHLPRLFERFYRVDAGRSRAAGGTGLGLAIVKHLLDANGGSIRVESEPGKGTSFVIDLPTA